MLKSWKEKKKEKKEREKAHKSRLPGLELALLRQLLASAKQTTTKHKKRSISECQDQSRDLPS